MCSSHLSSSLYTSLRISSHQHQIFLQVREEGVRKHCSAPRRSDAGHRELFVLLLFLSPLLLLRSRGEGRDSCQITPSVRAISHGCTCTSFVFISRHHSTGRAGATINTALPPLPVPTSHPIPCCPPPPLLLLLLSRSPLLPVIYMHSGHVTSCYYGRPSTALKEASL